MPQVLVLVASRARPLHFTKTCTLLCCSKHGNKLPLHARLLAKSLALFYRFMHVLFSRVTKAGCASSTCNEAGCANSSMNMQASVHTLHIFCHTMNIKQHTVM